MFFTLTICFAALAALVLWLIKPLQRVARAYGMIVSLIILAVFAVMAAQFDTSAASTVQFAETYSWIPQIGVSIAWGVNGMGLVMVGLAAFLVPVVFIASRNELDQESDSRAAGYVAWVLVLEAIMIGLFAARDVFVFYVLFELMIIPMYFLIGRYGGENRRRAAIKFLLYSLAGGLIMLVGVIALYVYAGDVDNAQQLYLVDSLAGIIPNGTAQVWLFISFFIAFAIKAPMFPVHTWLPDTTAQARPGTSTLLVGVLDKLGSYGMIAFCLPLFPDASKAAAMPIMILAVISIIWGGFAAIASRNLMRLIAFTSVSHFGFMILGIFSGSSVAMTGAIVYMVAHGVATGAMFLTVGALGQRTGTYEISRYGGLQRVTPLIAGVFLVSGLATIAMPGLSGFIPEFMVLAGTFTVHTVLGICAVFGMLLAALYLLWPYQKVFTGPVPEDAASYKDMNGTEKLVSAVLIVAMFYLGFAPAGIVNVVTPVGEQSAEIVATTAGDSAADVTLDEEGSLQ